jgi:hypothetical protein
MDKVITFSATKDDMLMIAERFDDETRDMLKKNINEHWDEIVTEFHSVKPFEGIGDVMDKMYITEWIFRWVVMYIKKTKNI